MIGYRRELLTTLECGERGLYAGVRVFFPMSLVHVLHNVCRVYDLRALERVAPGLVKARDFGFGGFRQWTHQVAQGTFQTQLPFDLTRQRSSVEQNAVALRGSDAFHLLRDQSRINGPRILVRRLAQQDAIDHIRLRRLPQMRLLFERVGDRPPFRARVQTPLFFEN
jgi:hypothetical protein